MDVTSFAWIVWLVLILVFVIIEMLTLDFIFLMLAVGSVGGLVSGLFGAPWWVQLIIAAILSVAAHLHASARRSCHALKRGGDPAKSNVDALIGMAGTVVSTGQPHRRARSSSPIGETWTARLTPVPAPARALAPGQNVVVVAIEGATAVVAPAPEAAGSDGSTERSSS